MRLKITRSGGMPPLRTTDPLLPICKLPGLLEFPILITNRSVAAPLMVSVEFVPDMIDGTVTTLTAPVEEIVALPRVPTTKAERFCVGVRAAKVEERDAAAELACGSSVV